MEPEEFTLLLRQWSTGERSALAALLPVAYQELRRIAGARMRNERDGHTLQPTALIHEAYLKLCDHRQQQWHSRAHFFSVASQIMREILVDNARAHRTLKRGSGQKVTLEEATSFAPDRGLALIQLDEALTELARIDDRKSRLIELKYFGGLIGEEISEVLGISISTITRESRMAEAWLRSYLDSAAPA